MPEAPTEAGPESKAPRRFKKRTTIPTALLALLLARFAISGVWADTTARNPSRSADA